MCAGRVTSNQLFVLSASEPSTHLPILSLEMPPRRSTTAPLPADDEATLLVGREAQALAGRHRQARADASEHQRIAGRASGAKRKAAAMSKADAAAKKAAHKREVRAKEKAAREAEAAREEQQALAASFSWRLFHHSWSPGGQLDSSAGLGRRTATWDYLEFDEFEAEPFKEWLGYDEFHETAEAHAWLRAQCARLGFKARRVLDLVNEDEFEQIRALGLEHDRAYTATLSDDEHLELLGAWRRSDVHAAWYERAVSWKQVRPNLCLLPTCMRACLCCVLCTHTHLMCLM
jgi:hypothetical protein